MRTAEAPGRHLSVEEIVDRVFPSNEGPIPVPLHLAACPDCQERVARLRESWLMDRGAVTGAVEALPQAFWDAQTGSVMQLVAAQPARDLVVRPFPLASLSGSFFRRPVLAFGSLAAALALVAFISFSRPGADVDVAQGGPKSPPATVVPSVSTEEQDRKDDELLRSVDLLLEDDAPLASLLPQEVS